MIRSKFIRSVALTLSITLALSCSTDIAPTAPLMAPTAAQDGLLTDLVGTVVGTLNALLGPVLRVIGGVVDPNGIEVHAVKWARSHDNRERSVSGTIGSNGGTLSIPTSDFTITFPAGALSKSTKITITSDGNGYVSYDMQPHGITFATPVIVTQRLRNTTVYGTPQAWNAVGAYFPKDPKQLDGTLKAVETTTTTIYAAPKGELPEVETWQLKHFSRYMLASG
jgi:hypothetical protein